MNSCPSFHSRPAQEHERAAEVGENALQVGWAFSACKHKASIAVSEQISGHIQISPLRPGPPGILSQDIAAQFEDVLLTKNPS